MSTRFLVMFSLFGKFFFDRVFVFSTSLYWITLHGDSIPITNSRFLKPSNIVKFVPSNTFMAVFRWFFIIMRRHLEGFTL